MTNPLDEALRREAHMRTAITLALESVQAGGGPFGAVVVKSGSIVGRGSNQVTTTNDPTAHAEIIALRDACRAQGAFALRGCEIYSSCEPCPMCLAAIHWARIDCIYYACTRAEAAAIGFDDAVLYEQIALPTAERRLPMTQMLAADRLHPMQVWQALPNKVAY